MKKFRFWFWTASEVAVLGWLGWDLWRASHGGSRTLAFTIIVAMTAIVVCPQLAMPTQRRR
jgi:hypothetical protein